jgi:hypothetical protein
MARRLEMRLQTGHLSFPSDGRPLKQKTAGQDTAAGLHHTDKFEMQTPLK